MVAWIWITMFVSVKSILTYGKRIAGYSGDVKMRELGEGTTVKQLMIKRIIETKKTTANAVAS